MVEALHSVLVALVADLARLLMEDDGLVDAVRAIGGSPPDGLA